MSNTTTTQTNYLEAGKLERIMQVAKAFYQAGCFNQTIKNEHQALTVILAGQEAGLQPVESMNSFYQIKGSLVMYGQALSKVISRAGVEIKMLKLNKKEIQVEYRKNGEVLHIANYTSADLPTGQAKGFAPEEKLVYHSHSRFLRYFDVGFSVLYTDYDQTIIEANEEKPVNTAKNEILEKLKIETVVVESQEDTPKIDPFSEPDTIPETSDGSLIEDKKPATNV